ncbi:2-succinyl-5-enolpyruvyl-6-hydroxy-3-cyclohexene-1-carboxylic-acid synthase [Auraticoccus sp. F435]|uniref:2-succinyl-5-enolpyruvyl-6-hydroxy-3-cyclohexene-1-carboxylate synthase n=1 Tax=Auraticoccus cholistanensis TaxID=2656650 RepID=A0A6A9UUU7_9ACTN|nr:2-succinyl-5-enolpyruvyl-6-hydroxy-3-cyclohexene-1-carboxylic-acid synthase [Auraticoccus cholistanensis]MVA75515.1 2-succinyl-5-enolpyruvyl-6-hydroxy-3-cyclohexene-1-carboxylic-acid synthase [Auraticoccus cholistanensis]
MAEQQVPSVSAALAVVEELVAGGVVEAVVSPGSRSAPLAYALEAAERGGLLRLHVRIDERSAAWTALGLARATGRAVVVVTTSGTAVANLHPAVLEADAAHVPLVVVSADRPAALVDTGANQTTRQVGMFAEAVRSSARMDAASPDALRAAVRRLLVAATGVRTGTPGPVHLNLELADPLVPAQPLAAVERVPAGWQVSRPEHPPAPLPADAGTVVLVGDADPATGAAARALAERGRVPLLSEPSGNARVGECAVAGYRLLLPGPLGQRITRVLCLGHPTLSRPVSRLLARHDVEVVVVGGGDRWPDPGHRVSRVLGAVELEPGPEGWLQEWLTADRELGARLAAELAARDGLTGPGLAAEVATSLRADDVWLLGSSSTVRDADLAPVWRSTGPQVHANRGLAGIDGTVSTAVGLALGTGRGVTALLGDLTWLHDANGLLIGPGEPRPDVRFVVANDRGGAIFATLEQGRDELAGSFERLFATPHRVDLAALAAAHGVVHRPVGSVAELRELLSRRIRGLELVEVRLDRSGRRELDERIRALA